MALLITEAEMLDRYTDGLKKSASRAGEFLTVEDKKRLPLFVDFIDGIKVAAGSAHQLAHAQMNPKWLDTRDILEGIITVSQKVSMIPLESGPYWIQIQQALQNMVETGQKLAVMKKMTLENIQSHLAFRAKHANVLADG